ncbi:uncharacterized protein LOC119690126 [Teleopsis dalmanni]|uniref:uncharacterized protein LOC119690126 n=1 Tax=Teleopsis dalmanni TaxID=139649 RepID=UPI0018CCA7B4|nr:uncharacterized protein LOC119690126 [Teleopsis dalmanni]
MSDTIKKQYATSFALIKDIVDMKKITDYIENIAKCYPENAHDMLEASKAEKKKLSDIEQRFEEKLTKSPLHVLLVANHFHHQWNNSDSRDKFDKKLEIEILSRIILFSYDNESEIIMLCSITNLTEAEEYLMNHTHLVSMQKLDLLTAYTLYLYMDKKTLSTKNALNHCINLSAILDEVEVCHISPDVSIKLQFAEIKQENKDNIHILREKIILILLSITTAIQLIFNDYSTGPPHEIFTEQNTDGSENESLDEDTRNTDELEIDEFPIGPYNDAVVDNEVIDCDLAVENATLTNDNNDNREFGGCQNHRMAAFTQNYGSEIQMDDESILSDSHSQTGSELFDNIPEDEEYQNDQQHSMVHHP